MPSDFIGLTIATKKITSILFILLGFAPLLFVLLFSMKQQSIRRRMKERMEEQMLHTITINNTDIRWEKEGKEIWVQGKMFDIKSIEYKDETTIFHGLFDDEETVLKKAFNDGWKKNSSAQNQLLVQLFQSLRGICLNPDTDFVLFPEGLQHLGSTSACKLPSYFQIILTPPPQIGYTL